MKMNRQEQGIYNEFMQDLESNTYTREEIVDKKMARAVKFLLLKLH